MRIIKEMKIEVASEITELDALGSAEGSPEQTHECAPAFLHLSGEGILITYVTEGEQGRVDSDISISGSTVTVKRRGALEYSFVFEEGVSHTSLYSVGPYSFDAVIRARRIRQGITDAGGRLDLYYTMTIGGAEKSVKMTIRLSPAG